MLNIMSAVLVAMVVVPALMAVVAFGTGQRWPRLIGRLGAAVAGLGFAGAVGLAVLAGGGDPVAASAGLLDLEADRLAVVLLLLVFGVSAVVQTFALRYLAGDPRANWFVGGAGLLTAASAGLMTVSSLVGLAVFWTAAGMALCLLLGMYWHLPAARDGVRRTAFAFLVGDLALWSAVAVATVTRGPVDLRSIEPGQLSGGPAALLATLVVIAALSRSAQIPFHRWLPATLTAPTPVSALLHAGVVNAGGILLIRLAPLATDDPAHALTILAGAATMAYGAIVMMVKPDVKGALVNSTSAQMGFMILTCGLGLWAAAVIHLVAHGFYKATLFLSSGSAIASRRRHEALPAALRPTRRGQFLATAATLAVPTAAVLAALAVAQLPAGDHAAEQALLGFAWVTGAAITWGWLQRRPGIAGVLSVAALLIPGTIAYLAVINAVSGFLAPALPPSALPTPAVWVITVTALVALAALAAARTAPGAERFQRLLYAHALSAGHLATSRTSSPALLTGVRS